MKQFKWIGFGLLLILAFSGVRAGNHNTYPLPEDRGTAGTLAALQKLPVYVRVLQVTAHPDDESSGTLTWLSRKFHAQTALFCLTRGEGGQNILGSEKYEALGLVRTGELLEACRYYGVDLFFGNVLDFGFSKTAEETLSKWGHDQTLGELVRFIRQWRPSIILSRFQGTPRDGHGHHQAAGILTREAYRAAADPQKFPEQFSETIRPWQAKKLYVSSMGGDRPPTGTGDERGVADGTVRIPVGDYDPVLGLSYREIASEGYSKHRTQGDGATFALPGRSYEYFRLVDSIAAPESMENSFFDSMDTSLMAILDLAGDDRDAIPFLREDLAAATQAAEEALQAFQPSRPENSAAAAARGVRILTETLQKVQNASLSPSTKELLKDALGEKLLDFQKAVSAALGIRLIARCQDFTGIPGDSVEVLSNFYNRGTESVEPLPERMKCLVQGETLRKDWDPRSGILDCVIRISKDAKVTEPYWYLANIRDARYKFRATDDTFAPFSKPEIRVEAAYRYRNTEIPINAVGEAQAGDPQRGSDFEEFQIVPALSVSVDPDFEIVPLNSAARECRFRVSVSNNQKSESRGTLKLVAGAKWSIHPAAVQFVLSRKGEVFTSSFTVQVPAGTKAGSYPFEAVATMNGQEFRRSQNTISYPENWTRIMYTASRSRLDVFDIQTAPGLTVGYIPGAGDDIPAALERLGIKTQILAASDLAFGNLSRFSAIITGIRAYNVNEDLRANNQRLLDYVAQGGDLIVQYVRPMGGPGRMGIGSAFSFAPYPMTVSDSDRITVEDSPVRILKPENPIFNRPNKITEADFQGWVQERGLYFMHTWDSHYTALIAGNDPGEEPISGGLLYARYGKGYYIYTGYAWFRQLPAGVPGAFRIFVNMLSLGSSQ